MKPTRRQFLHGTAAGCLAAGLPLPSCAEETALVLIQLSGGNDGLSTLVPWSDSVYHKKRPNIRIDESEVQKLDERVGLHPNLVRLNQLFAEGRVAAVQGAGYADPIRSHFRSMAIWHTARRAGRLSGDGWISRLRELAFPDAVNPETIVHVGARVPYALRSTSQPPITLSVDGRYQWVANSLTREALRAQAQVERAASDLRSRRVETLRKVMRDADDSSERLRSAISGYEPAADYPRGKFGTALGVVAATLSANFGARVLSVELDGFDTHVGQRRRHDGLMRTLDRGLGALHVDLERKGLLDRVVILVFSEFGRRVKENASNGTDHGTAGPMFVLGGGVRGGLHGKAPSLNELDEFDLEYTTDFRSVYSSVLKRCFAIDPERVLGGSYSGLDLFRPR